MLFLSYIQKQSKSINNNHIIRVTYIMAIRIDRNGNKNKAVDIQLHVRGSFYLLLMFIPLLQSQYYIHQITFLTLLEIADLM